MEIHADKQLMQYQPFSDPNVILRYSLVGMTAPPLSHTLWKHQPFSLPLHKRKKKKRQRAPQNLAACNFKKGLRQLWLIAMYE